MKIKLISIACIILIWSFVAKFYDPIILPSFWEVSKSLYNILKSGELYSSVFYSTVKLLIGLLFAVLAGLVMGLGMSVNKLLKNILHPIAVFLQSVPVISWILLALIWFVPDVIPIFILMINAMSIISFSVYEGIRGIDPKLIEMAKLYDVGERKLFFDLYLPSISSNFIGALKAVLASSYKVVVMSEVIARTDKGIGSKINWAWINIETSEILAWSILVVFLSYVLEKILVLNIKKVLEWLYA